MVSTLIDHHSIILMQLLIISSLKSVSRYISYREVSVSLQPYKLSKYLGYLHYLINFK